MMDYLTLVEPCRTTNEFNRLHIDLERFLAPLEIAHIAKRAGRLPRDSLSWLDRLRSLSPAVLDAPQLYERRVLTEHVSIYQQPRFLGSSKQLLVAFTGNKGLLMLPLAVFLQVLDSRTWDVVVVRKDTQSFSYLGGLRGVARSLPGVIRYIEKVVSAGRYRRLATIGTSGGGYAAIVAAILMGASRGVSVGGRLPPEANDSDPPIVMRAPPQIELRFVFGDENADDRREAGAMVEVFGGQLDPIGATDDHNVFRRLLERGTLSEFVREAIGDERSEAGRWQGLGAAFRRWRK